MEPREYAVLERQEEDQRSITGRSMRTMESARSLYDAWCAGKLPPAWRHTLGIILLLVTVVLWTASNFLASTIFADNTYSKPYFVTYINTAFFILTLIPSLVVHGRKNKHEIASLRDLWKSKVEQYTGYASVSSKSPEEQDAFLSTDNSEAQRMSLERLPSSEHAPSCLQQSPPSYEDPTIPLTLIETARLSFEFCFLWFAANYFVAACLEYTSVASSTILTSTSSVWTLIFGVMFGVEKFGYRKLAGVLLSLAGIIIVNAVDMSGENDENRGSFPHKTTKEIAIGDTLAFLSAVLYGVYAVLMKRRIGDESRINMPLFFGLVGLFNVLLLWPGMIILHFTGLETFELPPTGRILTIVLVNSLASLVSDMCWAYAMLLTSPLLVTVGISLTIPLSLVGQIILKGQYSGFVYWLGAGIVFLSFILVNREESKDEAEEVREAEARVFERDAA